MGDYEDKRALFEKEFKAAFKAEQARDDEGELQDEDEEFLEQFLPNEDGQDRIWSEEEAKFEADLDSRSKLSGDEAEPYRIPSGLQDIAIKGFDFEHGVMDPSFSHLKGRAYVFKLDSSDKAMADYRGKIMEQDRICKQIATDLQVWKNPYLRFPFATHRVAGVSVINLNNFRLKNQAKQNVDFAKLWSVKRPVSRPPRCASLCSSKKANSCPEKWSDPHYRQHPEDFA